MYIAEKPEILIEKMKSNFEEKANTIKDELLQLEQRDIKKNYYNLSGTQNFVNSKRIIILCRKRSIYQYLHRLTNV